tara:strand:+ start:347 stop:586 length:240 start_codon:yes stop_codon:yes gene_type:complete
MQISITVQQAKHIKKILSSLQHQHLAVEKQIRKKLKDHPENFSVIDLNDYELAIIGVYEIGFIADRLEDSIREHESSNN